MQHAEKRSLPRLPVGDVPRGALTLLHRGERILILNLRDISNAGISFSIPQQVAVSQPISVEYADAKVKMEVFGRVAWCSAARATTVQKSPGETFLLGVELLSPMMLYAVLPKR